MTNIRGALYNLTCKIRGIQVPRYLREIREADASGRIAALTADKLQMLLLHSQKSVPYYRQLFQDREIKSFDNPIETLRLLPQLSKPLLRQFSRELRSNDLSSRSWYENTSGGSTGEPVRLVQDREYRERSAAATELYSSFAGCKFGERRLHLWGSERDLFNGKVPWRTRFGNWLRNVQLLNAFCMTPERMRRYLQTINTYRPRLMICYAQAIYELARFAETERIAVMPPGAIITTAGTLYPFMREKITAVFGCRIFNRYGSREVSMIAGERPDIAGMIVSNSNNYLEVVDAAGNPLPAGVEGEILVTNLANFSMPLLRYAIGDRGIMADPSVCYGRQILIKVSGRNVDVFRKADGTLIDGEYFTHLLYFRDWLAKFQVVQRTTSQVVFKLVLRSECPPEDLDDIRSKTCFVLGADTQVDFEMLDDISESASGKYRYTISEVSAN
jgi:phenylacetate-CoA ligase